MKDFIKRRIREDLDYYQVGDANPESNKYEMGLEEIAMPSLSFAKNVEISDEEKKKIIALDWSDLIVEQKNESSPVHMSINVPWESTVSEGIAVDLQIVNEQLYQIHITLAPDLRGLGLGFKIYKALIMLYGHLYSGSGRRQNVEQVPKIWARLESDPQISCAKNDIADICVANNNPHKHQLFQMVGA